MTSSYKMRIGQICKILFLDKILGGITNVPNTIHINVCSSGVNFIVEYQLYSETKTTKEQVQVEQFAACCFAGEFNNKCYGFLTVDGAAGYRN